MKFIVIGGGLAGVPTAWYLRSRGHDVTLLDRAPSLAAESSHANGGILHAGNAEPWNSPAVAGELVRWLARRESPLRLRARELPRLAGWGLRFLGHSRRSAFERSWRANTALAVYSRACMPEITAHIANDWATDSAGSLKLYREAASRDRDLAAAGTLRALGVEVEFLDRAAVLAREPALADGGGDIVGAAWYPGDRAGDARLFCQRVGEAFTAAGGELRLGIGVEAIEGDDRGVTAVRTDQGRLTADRYVLAAGVDAPALAGPLGVRLPIRPVKGYSATLPAAGREGVPQLPIMDHDRRIVITRLGERLRVAGIAEFAGFDRRAHRARIDGVVDRALAALPAYRDGIDRDAIEPWACLRPVMVDGRPVLGPTPVPNLFLNVGAGHLGWTIAAGAGRLAADLAEGREPGIDAGAFAYDR